MKKYDLIHTDNYLVVVDESEIKEGDWYLRYNSSVLKCTELKESFNEGLNKNEIIILANECGDPYERSRDYLKKIIAHRPLNNAAFLEGVDVLPPLDVVEYDDIYADATEYALKSHSPSREARRTGYIDGYNKAKEKYKYTEEDMRKMWILGYNERNYEDSLQSLSQPMPVGFECETLVLRERPTDMRNHIYDKTYEVPKTITNSEGRTEWVGKYTY